MTKFRKHLAIIQAPLVICMLLICFYSNRTFACCCDCHIEKQYVAAEQLYITQEGIFVLLPAGLINLSKIEVDEGGIFITRKNYEGLPCPGCGLPLDKYGRCWNPQCPLKDDLVYDAQ